MNQPELLIKTALLAWEQNQQRMTSLFNSFTDEALQTPIAPGKNRIIYLLGHMTAVHDRMLPLLGLGERQYPQLDEPFITNPDNAATAFPPAQELRKYWQHINELLKEHFSKLSPEQWLQKHTMMTDEDYAKEPYRNRLSVLFSRTGHIASHVGQLQLVKK